ncbi:hypothetical protein DL96DRAFT_1723176 [Flagelloscypha sp. PMI_526]|nr:hypothetical protein DL96DRAFT_1723176 [Flagelloscypha sp. PMI_526]
MRFFATLICALGASISVVSAAHVRGRNALRMAQGLPPLPPRRTSRTDTARRNLPSSVSTPLLFDGDFEAESGSPWEYIHGSGRSGDSALCRSSSHCGRMTPLQAGGGVGMIQYSMSLTPQTDYTLTFYEYFQGNQDYEDLCIPSLVIDNNFAWVPPYPGFTESSTGYSQHTVAFTTSSSGSFSMTFALNCYSLVMGQWFVDDVSIAVATPVTTPARK